MIPSDRPTCCQSYFFWTQQVWNENPKYSQCLPGPLASLAHLVRTVFWGVIEAFTIPCVVASRCFPKNQEIPFEPVLSQEINSQQLSSLKVEAEFFMEGGSSRCKRYFEAELKNKKFQENPLEYTRTLVQKRASSEGLSQFETLWLRFLQEKAAPMLGLNWNADILSVDEE